MVGNTSRSLEIGKRIAQLRENCGLTQQQLAAQLSVKRETVNQWENGARQIKGPDIAMLADTLNSTCDYILRGVSSANIDIYRATGLSESSINYLVFCKKWGIGAEIAKVIDILIEDEHIQNKDGKRSYNSIINLLNFLFAYSDAGTGKKIRVDTKGTFFETEDASGQLSSSITLDSVFVENAVLLEIQNALLSIKRRLKNG